MVRKKADEALAKARRFAPGEYPKWVTDGAGRAMIANDPVQEAAVLDGSAVVKEVHRAPESGGITYEIVSP